MTASHLGNCVAGQPIKNNGTTVLGGGNAVTTGRLPNVTKNVSILANLTNDHRYGSHPVLAVSPTSSGNLGTIKAVSAGTFGKQTSGQYMARLLGTKIAGVNTSVLKSGASDFGVRKPIPRLEKTQYVGITSWDYVTGRATFSVNKGVSESFGTDNAARPTNAVPGKLVFFTGKPVPSATSYAAKYSY